MRAREHRPIIRRSWASVASSCSVLVLTVLVGIGVAWFARTGRWRQRRLVPITIAVLVAYVLLARRLGWGELLVVAVLVVPLVFLPVRLLGGSRPR